MNKINIVEDFTRKLDEVSQEFGVKIDCEFKALDKSVYFDLNKTDEIKRLKVQLSVKKIIEGKNYSYDYVSRDRKFGLRKFDKLNSQLSECFDWFSDHSGLNKIFIYRKIDTSLNEFYVIFS